MSFKKLLEKMERTKVQLFLSVEKFFQRVSLLIFVSDGIDLNLLHHASCCIKHFIIITAKKKNTRWLLIFFENYFRLRNEKIFFSKKFF